MTTAMILLNIYAQGGLNDPNRFNGYLILGYGLMWAIALFYILVLANRQRNVREEVHLLRQLLEEDEDSQNK